MVPRFLCSRRNADPDGPVVVGPGAKDLRLKSLPRWLSLPAIYCAYALIRGTMTGTYPYFFFDIGRFGLGAVLINCLGLLVVFSLYGSLMWAMSRLMRKSVLV